MTFSNNLSKRNESCRRNMAQNLHLICSSLIWITHHHQWKHLRLRIERSLFTCAWMLSSHPAESQHLCLHAEGHFLRPATLFLRRSHRDVRYNINVSSSVGSFTRYVLHPLEYSRFQQIGILLALLPLGVVESSTTSKIRVDCVSRTDLTTRVSKTVNFAPVASQLAAHHSAAVP